MKQNFVLWFCRDNSSESASAERPSFHKLSFTAEFPWAHADKQSDIIYNSRTPYYE